jgi:Asp-tRNA(Asn)/Glu-tRNA(Gln) amidotransferase A subunit family amidase
MFENGNPFRRIQSRTKLAVAGTLGTVLLLATLTPVLNIPVLPSVLLPGAIAADDNGKKEDKKPKFDIMEATIADVHKAIKSKQLTATELVNMYLERIKAYNGVCVNEPEGILGPVSTIPNAGQINALMTLNLRPEHREEWGFDDRKARSMTDLKDNDPNMPDALEVAAELDAHFAKTGKLVGPLHGIAFSIKDAYDTFDMRTTGGMDASYTNDRPPDDATFVQKLREAGAIILAKANLGEMGPGEYRSSFGGVICNPYDTERSPGGSSAGSGASVAANLVTCSIGEESGASVRKPARSTNVVGFAATQELVSRDGMIPGSFMNDRVGPICRTVEDVARVLNVIAGYDPKDEMTAFNIGRMPSEPYESYVLNDGDLKKKSSPLEGVRIGVVREYMDKDLFTVADHQSIDIIDNAIEDLEDLGAEIIDPGEGGALFQECIDKYTPSVHNKLFTRQFSSLFPVDTNGNPTSDHVPLLVDMFFDESLFPEGPTIRGLGPAPTTGEGKYMLNRYLQERGDSNIQSVTDLVNKANYAALGFDPFGNIKGSLQNTDNALTLDTVNRMQNRFALQQIVFQCMALLDLDAMVNPTSNIPPSKLGEPFEPSVNGRSFGGWNLLPGNGFPAISVPAGFTTEVFDRVRDPTAPGGTRLVGPISAELPVGIDFVGMPFDEPMLFKIASAYEAATHHRIPPPDFGPLDEEGNPINAATPGEPREIPKEPKVKAKDEVQGRN